MSAEAFLGLLDFLILVCFTIIVLIITIEIVAHFVCVVLDMVYEWRDTILDFVNRRTKR